MLTNKQIYDLNNMNVAAQNVQLGTLLNEMSQSLDIHPVFYTIDYFDNPPTIGEIMQRLYLNTEIPVVIYNGNVCVCSSVIMVPDGIDGGDLVPIGFLFNSHNTVEVDPDNGEISGIYDARASSYDYWVACTNTSQFVDGVYDSSIPYDPEQDTWDESYVEMPTMQNTPFFTVSYQNLGQTNLDLQTIITRFSQGRTPILQYTDAVNLGYNTIISLNVMSPTPIYSGNQITGLNWSLVYYDNNEDAYYVKSWKLENQTLESGQEYDASQDTWSYRSPLQIAILTK